MSLRAFQVLAVSKPTFRMETTQTACAQDSTRPPLTEQGNLRPSIHNKNLPILWKEYSACVTTSGNWVLKDTKWTWTFPWHSSIRNKAWKVTRMHINCCKVSSWSLILNNLSFSSSLFFSSFIEKRKKYKILFYFVESSSAFKNALIKVSERQANPACYKTALKRHT